MSDAVKKMMLSIEEKYGKPFGKWVDIVRSKNFEKHGAKIKFLKEEHAFSHGFANLVAHHSKLNFTEAQDDENLIAGQYKGKEHFLPLYENLKKQISKFGKDVEFAPKKSYVSLRRKKQFGCLNPASKKRFEIGINLKNQDSKGLLEAVNKSNAMFSHRINLDENKEGIKEAIQWLKKAYAAAE